MAETKKISKKQYQMRVFMLVFPENNGIYDKITNPAFFSKSECSRM